MYSVENSLETVKIRRASVPGSGKNLSTNREREIWPPMYGKMRLTQKLKQKIKEYRGVIVNKLQQDECACVRVCVRERERVCECMSQCKGRACAQGR